MNNSTELAPIVLFAYKRPAELAQTVSALRANYLAPESELYVFVDGPKHPFDLPKVEAVHRVADSIGGFRAVHRFYAGRNMGLAKSIIAGVSQVMAEHGRAIVLEDDLLTTRNFLDYMNQALRQYRENQQVFSISGYTFPFDQPANYDADGYVYPRTGSWGWASWADRWTSIDWELTDYDNFMADRNRCELFDFYGSDRLRMLRRWQAGLIDSWAIRWCYAQAKVNGVTLYPTVSKVDNIGFSQESTNTHGYNRYRTILDAGVSRTFNLPQNSVVPDYYLNQMRWKFSLTVRAVNRLFTHAQKAQRWFTQKN
ncbi:glycosyltransferase [Fibrella sp. HMF5335]|uniref:Glycosyltransferase n=1 Tax=Fibrella rubiginis TaxID=2817060 RepID=A0A939K6G6_9BACT|nr:glycosyltransferase [Fibrella rubiginis]MBO0938813.1 glycosyltransferase [Fibrella rubiginis]